MKAVHAIYENRQDFSHRGADERSLLNGVFRPLGDVDVPDQAEVEFVPQLVRRRSDVNHLDGIYEILSQSFDTDDPDLASRHNEHQP